MLIRTKNGTLTHNKEIFVKESREIHGDRFNYDKFEYLSSKIKSTLICNKCGYEFLSTPSNHLLVTGCKNCDNIKKGHDYSEQKLSRIYPEWIFDMSNYKNRDSIIYYVCEKGHKDQSKISSILKKGFDQCRVLNDIEKKKVEIEKNNLTILKFSENINCQCNCCGFKITKSYKVLSSSNWKCKYCQLIDKSELLRTGKAKLVEISSNFLELICENNHKYKQDVRNLLSGKSCNICYQQSRRLGLDQIKSKISEIHGDFFKYDFSQFQTLHSKIDITCEKGHNFKQKISNHLQGKGCPICRESSGERKIRQFLENNKIDYIRQKKFKGLEFINKLAFDFYLPKYNTCLEFDGIQHFEPVALFGGEKGLESTKIRDEMKNQWCLVNNIKLIRINYKEDLLTKLKSIGQ